MPEEEELFNDEVPSLEEQEADYQRQLEEERREQGDTDDVSN